VQAKIRRQVVPSKAQLIVLCTRHAFKALLLSTANSMSSTVSAEQIVINTKLLFLLLTNYRINGQ